MATTYEPIATTTLGSAQSSVTFSSISGSYTDLIMVWNGLVENNTYAANLKFNTDTGTNYSFTRLTGNGSSAASSRSSNISNSTNWYGGAANGLSSSNTNSVILQIFNYANTTTYKTWISRTSSIGVETNVGLWRSTAAITSITLGVESGTNYSSGSTFTLYGIKAA